MHFQESASAGPALDSAPIDVDSKPSKTFTYESSSLPFGQHVSLSQINGSSYLTAQTLVQQVAYTLSDKVFTYSPETFDLDVALKHWQEEGDKNAHGYIPGIHAMETRAGAGSIALGYVFSQDFDLKKRHIPQSIVASSASLAQLRPALDQLSLLYDLANPFVAHIAAVDHASSGLVTDYTASLKLADELGLGLVSSASAHEIQHMALLATLLASTLPAIHTFDGVNVARETTLVADAIDQLALKNQYTKIQQILAKSKLKNSHHDEKLLQLFSTFNAELGTSYKPFEYFGHAAPEHVLVVFGTVEASTATQLAQQLANKGSKVGVINVRVYRPFLEDEFIRTLPKSAKSVAVLGQVEDDTEVADATESSLLYKDVLAALSFSSWSGRGKSITDIKYPRSQVWTPSAVHAVFQRLLNIEPADEFAGLELPDTTAQQYTFWSLEESPTAHAPIVLGNLLTSMSSSHVTVRTGHDSLIQGGAVRTDIRSSKSVLHASYAVDNADAAFVTGEKLLGEFDVLNSLKTGGALVLTIPGAKDDDLEKKIPVGLRQALATKKVQLFILDPTLSTKFNENPELESLFTQLAFLKLSGYLGSSTVLQKLAAINSNLETINELTADVEKSLRQIEYPESWATVEGEVESISLPTDLNVNSFSRLERLDPAPPNYLEDWTAAAKGLVFKEAYGTKSSLRPDLGVKTGIVTVKEHRRLTPLSYDRNIFHIEFDLGDSGITYAIGEALGIHAENDKAQIEQFIKWYGLNPDEIVQVPSRDDANILENRTVYQALLQNVDIFGRPPKKFYEALAEFADDPKEKQNLLTLSTPDGATEFKRRAEVDTVTFADILLEFPSAHPSFHDIVKIVSPMKRREYSIASSQKVTPTSVALLIVTVNWVDPQGRDRFGQATKYLNALPVGAPVTVSVKPSVMKLPTKTTAPIIMAGLGTGLAPFRAFVQERAWQKEQGHEIGAVFLYMGARHQREEYLYGEEWEAYRDAGIITLLGRAFSRDQPQKIYIQDRMRQTLDEVRQAYLKDEGSFYLCGPTWPVPDVTEVLQEAYEVEEKSKGTKKIDSRRAIEEFKDAGRYVLEVY
jgi:sulfite reductase (NADPH) flavoprotein alpha-component